VILKARQRGFTTFIQLYMLDACLFHENIRAGTIATRYGCRGDLSRQRSGSL